MADDPVVKTLTEAAKGLLYPSDSDNPFDVVSLPADTGTSAREVIAKRAGAGKKIEEADFDAFFSELDSADDAAGFQRLRKALESQLTDPKVFRVGDRKIDVYLVGKDRSGKWTGLHTISVET